jgi:hypothetical protein
LALSKFKWFSGLVVAAGVAAGAAGAAQASTVCLVSSTNVEHCGTAPHGLWTGQQNFSNGGSCGNYYDISPGTTLVINDDDADPLNWSGTLDGFAVNPKGLQAEIHLTLSDFAETAKYKTENGVVYDQNTDTPDIDFFQNVVGTIEIVTSPTPSIPPTRFPEDIRSSGVRAPRPSMPANLAARSG